MAVLRPARVALLSSVATLGTLALARSAAAALGGDGRAAVLVAAVAALAFGIGAGRAALARRRAAIAAAIVATVAMLALPAMEATLAGWVRAAGESWRADVVTALIAAAAMGLPMASLGAASARDAAARPAPVLAGAAAALLALDAPWVPFALAQILALAAPLALAWFGVGTSQPPVVEPEGDDPPRRERVALAALGAGLAFALILARIESRAFLRGTTWELAQVDATMLVLLALGAFVFAWALEGARATGKTLAVALAVLGLLLGLRRLYSISLPVPFADVQRWWGFTTDGPLDAALFTVITLSLTFLTAGGAAGTALARGGRRAAGSLALGLGAGLAVATCALDGRSLATPEGGEIVGGLLRFVLLAVAALGAAALLFAVAPRDGWVRVAANVAILVVCALPVSTERLLRPIPFRPANLFPNERSGEGHSIHAIRETVDGVAVLVEEPVREDGSRMVRTRRVRVDRVDRTPDLDDRGGYELAIATAAAIHGAPENVLLLAPPLPRTIELLQRAGAKRIDSAPLPATASAVAAPFGAVELGDVGPDGLRPAAGQRGYDLVVLPPTPSFPADVSASMRARHLRALEAALAPSGLLAVFLDGATTPPDVVVSLASALAAGREQAGAIFVADGVHGASLGLLVREGAGPLVSTRSATVPAALAEFAPSLPPDVGSIRAQIFSPPNERGAGAALSDLLPPASTARSFAWVALDARATRAATARLAERWIGDASGGGARASAKALASAVAAMEGADYRRNFYRPPAETIPIPSEACDAVAAGLRALPGPGAARAAYRQLSHLMRTQREVSRLNSFASAVHAADPGDWEASRDLAATTRELLDPEAALKILDQMPPPDGEEGLIDVTVERSKVLLALKRSDEAIAVLLSANQNHPASLELAVELAETYKTLGKLDDAKVWALHAETLNKASGARGH